jgi:hypothetical protein
MSADIFKISAKADFWTVLCLNLAMVFVPLFGLVALFSALAFIDALSAGARPAHFFVVVMVVVAVVE